MHRFQPIILAAGCWSAMTLVWILGSWFICLGDACPTEGLDYRVLRWFAEIRSGWLDGFFRTVTWAGSLFLLLPVTLFVALLLLRRKKMREALFFAAAFGGAAGFTVAAKLMIARPRPALFPACCPVPGTPSFPSSHTAQIAAFVAAALFLSPGSRRPLVRVSAGLLGLLAVLFVAASRLYLQVHYFSDILASILTAALWVAGLAALMLGGGTGNGDR
jgi:undecaprenyl-diphosphatase